MKLSKMVYINGITALAYQQYMRYCDRLKLKPINWHHKNKLKCQISFKNSFYPGTHPQYANVLMVMISFQLLRYISSTTTVLMHINNTDEIEFGNTVYKQARYK